jgi:hypothetical protein
VQAASQMADWVLLQPALRETSGGLRDSIDQVGVFWLVAAELVHTQDKITRSRERMGTRQPPEFFSHCAEPFAVSDACAGRHLIRAEICNQQGGTRNEAASVFLPQRIRCGDH